MLSTKLEIAQTIRAAIREATAAEVEIAKTKTKTKN